MNYKNITVRAITEFSVDNPTMTLPEIIYSIIREGNSGVKSISDIKNITDEEFYTLVEKAKQFEKE